MNKLLVFILIGIILLSGCVSQTPDKKEQATAACIQECQKVLNTGQDLSKGPCLSNKIVEDWVCDVAHEPRIPEIDNKLENQCSAWQVTAHHFVEVDPTCKFIKAV